VSAPSVRDAVDKARMSPFQITAVAICLLINLVDGFDVLVMAFAAPGVAAEWGVSQSQIGILLSSVLVGMAIGSAFLAPLADRIGRRPLTLACLALCTAGMAVAAFSADPLMLGASRLLSGLGIGGMVATLPVVITEYAPRRLRGTMVALYGLGLPIGGVLGGAVAATLVASHGWRSLFLTGAAITLLLLCVVAVAMPESLDYLIDRRPAGALAKVNGLLARMRLASIAELPGAGSVSAPTGTGQQEGIGLRRSVLLWLAYFVMMAGFYFAASWTPLLLEQSGYSAEEGLQAGLLLNIGGIVGTLLVAGLALRIAPKVLAILSFVAAGGAYLVLSLFLELTWAALAGVVAVGLCINAGGTGLNALAPGLYPTSTRATGVGWAMAIGRIGALTAPVLAGVLLEVGWSPRSLFGLFALPLLVAAGAIAAITLRPRRRSPAVPATPAPIGPESVS
jgi:benzoate transport